MVTGNTQHLNFLSVLLILLIAGVWSGCMNGTADSTPSDGLTETMVPASVPDEVVPPRGTLTVITRPVMAGIYVDGELKAYGYWSDAVSVGHHLVTFDSLEGFESMDVQHALVLKDKETVIYGEYRSLEACGFEDVSVDNNAYNGELVSLAWNSSSTISFNFLNGTGWSAVSSADTSLSPASGEGPGAYKVVYDPAGYLGFDTVTFYGEGTGGNCSTEIKYYVWDEYSPPYILTFYADPNPVQRYAQTTLHFTILEPCSTWTLESYMGNPINPTSGSGAGTFTATLTANYLDDMPYDDDIITLTANGINFGIHSIATLQVNIIR